jgi:hypothetical protein
MKIDRFQMERTQCLDRRAVLITPGAHFGIGKYIRLGFGYEISHTLRGLEKLDAPLAELKKRKTAAAGKASA